MGAKGVALAQYQTFKTVLQQCQLESERAGELAAAGHLGTRRRVGGVAQLPQLARPPAPPQVTSSS